jgi:hypothetical protein
MSRSRKGPSLPQAWTFGFQYLSVPVPERPFQLVIPATIAIRVPAPRTGKLRFRVLDGAASPRGTVNQAGNTSTTIDRRNSSDLMTLSLRYFARYHFPPDHCHRIDVAPLIGHRMFCL